jgi:phosphoribosylamine--glycine ligase
MGAYVPASGVDAALLNECIQSILQPTVDGMAARGTPYVGILYAGLMLTPQGPRVLEFNCRFGDPEAQAILPLLAGGQNGASASLFGILMACVDGRLNQVRVAWKAGTCATVVLASPGYPGRYPTGFPIAGLDGPQDEHVVIFHAGTAHKGDHIITAGGRVMAVSATGADLAEALRRSYNRIHTLGFEQMHYRHDIGG